jgi:hypothetical protein
MKLFLRLKSGFHAWNRNLGLLKPNVANQNKKFHLKNFVNSEKEFFVLQNSNFILEFVLQKIKTKKFFLSNFFAKKFYRSFFLLWIF